MVIGQTAGHAKRKITGSVSTGLSPGFELGKDIREICFELPQKEARQLIPMRGTEITIAERRITESIFKKIVIIRTNARAARHQRKRFNLMGKPIRVELLLLDITGNISDGSAINIANDGKALIPCLGKLFADEIRPMINQSVERAIIERNAKQNSVIMRPFAYLAILAASKITERADIIAKPFEKILKVLLDELGIARQMPGRIGKRDE